MLLNFGTILTANGTAILPYSYTNTNYLCVFGYYDYDSPGDTSRNIVQWKNKTLTSISFDSTFYDVGHGAYYTAKIDYLTIGFLV